MTEELRLLRRLLDAVEAADEPPTRRVRLLLRSVDAPWMEEDPDAVWCSFGKGKPRPPANAAEERPEHKLNVQTVSDERMRFLSFHG